MKKKWEICRYFIFRCAGFPFELIEKNKFADTYRAIDNLLERQENPSHLSLKEIFEEELFKKRLQLKEIAANPKFQEAVLHQNQNSLQNDAYQAILNFAQQKIDRETRNYDDRRKELLAYRYLQRFCTKNETVSFFGPFYIGEFNHSKKNILYKSPVGNKIKNRKVYTSTWLLEAILEKVIHDDEIFRMLKPLRVPAIQLMGTEVINLITGNKTKLDKLGLQILKLIERGYNVGELARKIKKDGLSEKNVYEQIRWLIEKKILLSGLEYHSKIDEPAEYVIDKLSWIPAAEENEWYIKLKKLLQLKSKFEKADLVGRSAIINELKNLFSELAGYSFPKDVTKEKGFFSEKCELNLEELKLGKNIYHNLQNSLSLILNLAIYNGAKLNQLKSSLLNEWLKKNFKRRMVNIKDVIYKIAQEKGIPPFKWGDADISKMAFDSLPSEFLSIINSNKEKRAVKFNQEDLERKLAKYLDNLVDAAGGCCDIMICAPDKSSINEGNYQTLFCESHTMRKPLSIYKWSIEITSRGKIFAKEIEKIHKIIKRRSLLGEFLISARDILDRSYDFPSLLDIEAEVYSLRKRQKISISDLKLRWDNNSVSLVGQDNKSVLLLSPIPSIGSLFALLPPRVFNTRLGNIKTHFPRAQINNFIFQREQWIFLKDDLFFSRDSYNKQGIELWLELESWRRKEGMPRQFFLKIAYAEKPVFIDFENYFSVEVFKNLAKKSYERLYITEMLPGPENLWFKDGEGRYTCEFRLIVYKG